ncbi:putative P-loop containing nucleoside triphosphate hydrolase [Monocercomonoides exilis]|uniref:putative P-loop containing nucleoside triphosphate hydrolase n=1 Tax=Monocercomonoides exilis TaxID=2049356 RepID=UPI0035598898|nr:putative P-loop containing nucleoside triphosphate hydrolase [Monocercomonoides exilis]|eukprot:MONOS_6313.1-p1 / transcript=MONOS_6313.1 / gene=MONOS_6313 / organism=Monocercomonoides_exilis_PA203 / gene_product=P-loop containing nucleoside triphosphate hydrolase / transcript_product=P-loop containing nucleoside triphosphate hydrolase / location=Mono_scaffold00197:32901-35181(+) / protein_length=587 / sequence_SO=supercontig / SO=protein_coding / is_pseudo=false
MTTFQELGISDDLSKICLDHGWKAPRPIQVQAIPHALKGRDVVGLAETGSGKTGAFVLPILQDLLDNKRPCPAAVVLSPTRELALQIAEEFQIIGRKLGLKCALIVGGVDLQKQVKILSDRPHVIVATPGRLFDHIRSTKGFSIDKIKFLVLDEADRLLNPDFKDSLDAIIHHCPRDRITFLFSATMTNKVTKLQRTCLKNPVKVSVSASKLQTVSTLRQRFLFFPQHTKMTHLVALLLELAGKSTIVFTRTCPTTLKTGRVLQILGIKAEALHGQMDQQRRFEILDQFKKGKVEVLVATDVASRGLDIPSVACVINFDLPQNTKTYLHRVGRTARAGRTGLAFSFVTQYDVVLFKSIEDTLGEAAKAKERKEKKEKAMKKKKGDEENEEDDEDNGDEEEEEMQEDEDEDEEEEEEKEKEKEACNEDESDEGESGKEESDEEIDSKKTKKTSSKSKKDIHFAEESKKDNSKWQMEQYKINPSIIHTLERRVVDAERLASIEMRDAEKKKGKRSRTASLLTNEDEDEGSSVSALSLFGGEDESKINKSGGADENISGELEREGKDDDWISKKDESGKKRKRKSKGNKK